MQTSNQVLSVILEGNKIEATKLTTDLQDMRQTLEEEGDAESSLFLKVLQVLPASSEKVLILSRRLSEADYAPNSQGMLQHTLLKDADKLDGMFAQALNRIYNQVLALAAHCVALQCTHAPLRSALPAAVWVHSRNCLFSGCWLAHVFEVHPDFLHVAATVRLHVSLDEQRRGCRLRGASGSWSRRAGIRTCRRTRNRASPPGRRPLARSSAPLLAPRHRPPTLLAPPHETVPTTCEQGCQAPRCLSKIPELLQEGAGTAMVILKAAINILHSLLGSP